MAKHKQRQSLAVSARLSPQIDAGTFPGLAVLALEEEAARIVAESAEKRANGRMTSHVVASGSDISGFIKCAHTMVRFA